MAQQVKVTATQPEDPGSVPGPTSCTSMYINSFVFQIVFSHTDSIVTRAEVAVVLLC